MLLTDHPTDKPVASNMRLTPAHRLKVGDGIQIDRRMTEHRSGMAKWNGAIVKLSEAPRVGLLVLASFKLAGDDYVVWLPLDSTVWVQYSSERGAAGPLRKPARHVLRAGNRQTSTAPFRRTIHYEGGIHAQDD